MSDLISRTTRGLFRDLMTSSTWEAIGAAFQDEGSAPNPDCTYEDSSVRRRRTQEHLESVDWQDPGHVARALRAFERLLGGYDDTYTEQFRHSLRRDGHLNLGAEARAAYAQSAGGDLLIRLDPGDLRAWDFGRRNLRSRLLSLPQT